MKFMSIFTALSMAVLVLTAPEPEIIEEKRQGAYRMRSMNNSLTHIYKVKSVINSIVNDVTTPGESNQLTSSPIPQLILDGQWILSSQKSRQPPGKLPLMLPVCSFARQSHEPGAC